MIVVGIQPAERGMAFIPPPARVTTAGDFIVVPGQPKDRDGRDAAAGRPAQVAR